MCPAVLFDALAHTRFLNSWALLVGWATGTVTGTWMAWTLNFKTTVYVLHLFGVTVPGFAALYALIVNIVVAVALSLVVNALIYSHHATGLRHA